MENTNFRGSLPDSNKPTTRFSLRGSSQNSNNAAVNTNIRGSLPNSNNAAANTNIRGSLPNSNNAAANTNIRGSLPNSNNAAAKTNIRGSLQNSNKATEKTNVHRSLQDYKKAIEKAVSEKLLKGNFLGNTFLMECFPNEPVYLWLNLIFSGVFTIIVLYIVEKGFNPKLFSASMALFGLIDSILFRCFTKCYMVLDFENKSIYHALYSRKLTRLFKISNFSFNDIKGVGVQSIIYGKSDRQASGDVVLFGKQPTAKEKEENLLRLRSSSIVLLYKGYIKLISSPEKSDESYAEYCNIAFALAEIIGVPSAFAEKSQKLIVVKDNYNRPKLAVVPYFSQKEVITKQKVDQRMQWVGYGFIIVFILLIASIWLGII